MPIAGADYTAVHSILYVVDRAGTRPQALARAGSGKHPALFDQPVWAPDGKSIFVAESDPFSGGRARVREIRVADGRERVIAQDASSNVEYLAVSPGGKQVAFVAGESIDLVELASGERRSVASLRSEFVDGLKWSADGAELAYALSNANDEVAIDLYVIKTDGSDRRLISTPGDPVGAFDWRPSANQGRLAGVARNLAG